MRATLVYEDELPEIADEIYDDLYEKSFILYGVRMYIALKHEGKIIAYIGKNKTHYIGGER